MIFCLGRHEGREDEKCEPTYKGSNTENFPVKKTDCINSRRKIRLDRDGEARQQREFWVLIRHIKLCCDNTGS